MTEKFLRANVQELNERIAGICEDLDLVYRYLRHAPDETAEEELSARLHSGCAELSYFMWTRHTLIRSLQLLKPGPNADLH